jgi:ATP-dependent DNA ligase
VVSPHENGAWPGADTVESAADCRRVYALLIFVARVLLLNGEDLRPLPLIARKQK